MFYFCLGKSKIDEQALDELEDVLIQSDVGVDTTLKIIKALEKRIAQEKYISTSDLVKIMQEEIIEIQNTNHDNDEESNDFDFY